MTNLEQAARQALDVMEAALDHSVDDNNFSCRAILAAQIDVFRAALAQQAEPVTSRPRERDYASFVGYARALEEHCDALGKQAEPVVDDLVTLVLRMARDLKRAGHPAMADRAVDFLRRKGLQPSPLRDDSAALEQAEPVDEWLTDDLPVVDKEQAASVVDRLEKQGLVMPPGGDAGPPII